MYFMKKIISILLKFTYYRNEFFSKILFLRHSQEKAAKHMDDKMLIITWNTVNFWEIIFFPSLTF